MCRFSIPANPHKNAAPNSATNSSIALVEARAATFGLCAVALGLACLVMPIITERRRPDDLLPGAMPFEERQRLEQEWERVNLGRRPESAPRLRCVK